MKKQGGGMNGKKTPPGGERSRAAKGGRIPVGGTALIPIQLVINLASAMPIIN
jgi:hypothetical protein